VLCRGKMPYLIISNQHGEIERCDLRGPATIGRSLLCDISIRDALLSRTHCRIEPCDGNWAVVDLGSRNGTHVDDQLISSRLLADGQVICIGRTRICFRSGRFVPPDTGSARSLRPADPIEAMATTVVGMVVGDMQEQSRRSGFPIPRPRAHEESGARQLNGLVGDIASGPRGSGSPIHPSPAPRVLPAPKVTEKVPALSGAATLVSLRRCAMMLSIALASTVCFASTWVISWGW
ncbi:MAG: FHA domain-containing protein, partial [Tepidisphaeraceae bacterium]